MTLNNMSVSPMVFHMIKRTFLLIAILVALPFAAHAACYADYRAKQDNPLRFHYGVVKVSNGSCPSGGQVRSDVAGRIARDGWQLVGILGIFGDEGLNDKRRADAGGYYLRY